MTEIRTVRSVYAARNVDDETYFGRAQMDAIRDAITSHADVRLWLFASTIPLLYMKRKIIEIVHALNSREWETGLMNRLSIVNIFLVLLFCV